jgi:hypothetical protein
LLNCFKSKARQASVIGGFVAAATLTLAAVASGADKYGPAGCGLGSLIFEPNSGFTQVLAATTNGTFGSQTFGISSGTSNCEGNGGGKASAKAFVETNRVALAKDIARGQGETIDSLAKLAGCQHPQAVGATLQRSFGRIFPSAAVTDGEVSQSVVETLAGDSALMCRKLG